MYLLYSNLSMTAVWNKSKKIRIALYRINTLSILICAYNNKLLLLLYKWNKVQYSYSENCLKYGCRANFAVASCKFLWFGFTVSVLFGYFSWKLHFTDTLSNPNNSHLIAI